MISGVLRIRKEDVALLENEIRSEAAKYTDERVTVVTLLSRGALEKFLDEKAMADIICVDVSVVGGIPQAEQLRQFYPKAAIILIADAGMSPVSYMKPTILAASLLLLPLIPQHVHRSLEDVFRQYITKTDDSEVFRIETREETHQIPLSSILYFEAREKRVYACTENREYGFYETMDRLAERMQSYFVRCHRSYLANIACIDRVMLSKNTLLLKQGIDLPLSRSYKNEVKLCVKQ
ncbi:MAG: LytTR family transcriptional regulator DNA-binding domain-containing protein [Lachnospiraceae bacterium]|nr:LytTR family transcriptional regulator DNA-binding domain-containing protein [Lachnospiraceae bacterium]